MFIEKALNFMSITSIKYLDSTKDFDLLNELISSFESLSLNLIEAYRFESFNVDEETPNSFLEF